MKLTLILPLLVFCHLILGFESDFRAKFVSPDFGPKVYSHQVFMGKHSFKVFKKAALDEDLDDLGKLSYSVELGQLSSKVFNDLKSYFKTDPFNCF